MVRDQIAAMIEAARDNAAEIERVARSAGGDTRATGAEAASAVVERIDGIERELALLLRNVTQEADGLRAQLDRAKLGSAFRPPSGRGAIEGEVVSLDPVLTGATAASPVPEQAEPEQAEPEQAEPEQAEPEQAEPEQAEPEQAAADLDAEERPPETEEVLPPPAEPVEGESLDPGDEAVHAEEPPADQESSETQESPGAVEEAPEVEEESQEAGQMTVATEIVPREAGDKPSETTPRLTEAEASVSDKTDLDLAELHNLARARAADADVGDDAEYWRGVAESTVQEAASRPVFGVPGPDEELGGRRGKKRRTSVLEPLREARDEALKTTEQDGSQDAASQHGEDSTTPDDRSGAEDEQSVLPSETDTSDRQGLLSRLSRRGKKGPFVTTPGHCAVCQKTFMAGSVEQLQLSGWKVNGDVGLCPEDQAEGWQLPEGARLPFRRGGS